MRLFLIFILSFQSCFSQSLLKGKVISDEGKLTGILIVNEATKEMVSSDVEGEFSISAKPKDILIIASPQIEGLSIVLNTHSFEQKPLQIKVNLKIHELDEVTIRRITTKSLGIVSSDTKEYSPAERRLYTSKGGFKNQYGLDTRISLDGILNFFSGRTANLEKQVQIEKYERYLKKIKSLVEEEFYSTTLHFLKDEIDGFLVFASEDPEIGVHLETNNKNLLKLKLVTLALQYKERLYEK